MDDARRRVAVSRGTGSRLLAAVLALESAGMIAVAVFLGVEAATAPSQSLTASIALIVLAAICAMGVGVLAGLAWRGRRARGAMAVWQALQLVAGVNILQGGIGSWMGWVIVVLAVGGGVLLVVGRPGHDVGPAEPEVEGRVAADASSLERPSDGRRLG